MDAFMKERNKEKEIITLVKVHFLQDNGLKMKKFKASLFYLMEIFLKEILEIIWDTVGFIDIRMVIFTKDIGKMM